jgi:hypothetical protein
MKQEMSFSSRSRVRPVAVIAAPGPGRGSCGAERRRKVPLANDVIIECASPHAVIERAKAQWRDVGNTQNVLRSSL